jgi:hypothetical protein
MNIINWRLPIIILILSTILFLPLIVKASINDKEFFFATGWKLASMSYRDCILEAKKVLDFVKFNVKLDYQMKPENDGSGSAWGQQQWQNNLYKAVIRCVPTERMVFFVVGGYNPKKVREYVNIFLETFQVSSENFDSD